ncbi:MAG: hypothetical protein NVS2B7_12310 [Herpetosiphon sp.]
MRNVIYALRSLARSGTRSAAYLIGLSLAVALFSSTLFFIDGSARSMTQRAIAPVVLDFRVRAVDPKVDVTTFITLLQQHAGITAAAPFAAGTLKVGGGSVNAAVPARLFAVSPEYLKTFPLLTITTGSFVPGQALISEQLAISQGLHIGDPLMLTVPGLPAPYKVLVSGTVNTDLAEPLFAGPTAAPEGAFTVSTAVVMDYATFARDLSAAMIKASEAARTNVDPAAAAQASVTPVLDRQIHLRIARTDLPADPGNAQRAIGALRRNVEQQLSGKITVSDNISASLKNAAKDVISARLLFIFLGLPGVLLAAYLSRYATQLVTEAQRREVALLRTRGIGSQQVLLIMAWTAVFIALVGTLIGLLVGALSTVAIFGAGAFMNSRGLVLSAVAALALGLLLGSIGVFLPARRMLQGEISEERRLITAGSRPLWLRLPLDLLLLTAAALVLWFSGTYATKNATAGASETAAVSLGIYSFLGPLLFWMGAVLLFWRVADWLLSRRNRRWSGGLNGLATRSLRRRSGKSIGAALLLALAISFGVATTVFGSTYTASRQAEARYFVGSDIRVTPALTTPQPPSFADSLKVAGVRAVAPIEMVSNAVVGAQTQTVYGVDVARLKAATAIQDSFFVGTRAVPTLDSLAATPNGLLISHELADAYNIQLNDTVNIQFRTATGSPNDARLQVVGIFTVFPTSSQNSDLVVNSTFLQGVAGKTDPAFYLLKSDGTAATNAAISRTLNSQFAGKISARIETADRAISADQSSLVGLNLAGLVAIDRVYAVLIITLGMGVFLLGSIVERQRELGTLQALGATPRQVTRLLLIEAALLASGGVIGGLVIGALLAWQYNGFLPGIFAVAQPIISVPLPEVGLLLGLGFAGVCVAALVATLRLRSLWPADVLREA